VTPSSGKLPESSGDSAQTRPVEPGLPGRREHGSEEEIDEAGDESFPASDAPQWWSGEPGDNDE
jgi:hypothetical protein